MFDTSYFSFTFAQVMTVFASLAVLVTVAKPIYSLSRLPQSLDNLADAVHELKTGQEVIINRITGVETGEAASSATIDEHGKQLQNHEIRIGKLEG